MSSDMTGITFPTVRHDVADGKDLNISYGNIGGVKHSMLKLESEAAAIAATRTLTILSKPVQILTLTGAQDVVLPAEALSTDLVFYIWATGATATVKDDGGSSIDTVASGVGNMFHCDGTTWRSLNAGA